MKARASPLAKIGDLDVVEASVAVKGEQAVGSLLITGASGFLGWHACRYFSKSWQVCGTYHSHPMALDTAAVHALDLRDEASIQACWEDIKPGAVLHTAAVSKVNQCQQDPAGSFLVNVTGTVKLAERCAAAGIPFIFTSTDLVFDGTKAPYAATDAPSPLHHYGEQKATAETQILAAYPEATICRLPLMYGAATPTATCFVQGFLDAIAVGKTLTLFTDEFRTPVEVTDAIQGLQLVLDQKITGIIHLGGPQRLNRYEFGLLMAEAFKVSSAAMKPCLQSSVSLPVPRPQDVSLDSEIAFSLGYSPRTVEVAFAAIAACA